MASRRVSTTAREILGYFVRNPDAADSLEGIARWRLLEQVIHRTISDTEVALKWLVAEGYLIETELLHSRRLFQLNPEKYSQAQSLLLHSKRGH